MSRQVDPFDEFAPGLTAAEELQCLRFWTNEQQVAECTGLATAMEQDHLFDNSFVNEGRRCAVLNFMGPGAPQTLRDWAEQECHENFGAMLPGEICQFSSDLWSLCKMLVLSERAQKEPLSPSCFCLPATHFMPSGCTHLPAASGGASDMASSGMLPVRDSKLPNRYCRECSRCIRCSKICWHFRLPEGESCECTWMVGHKAMRFAH